MTYSPIPSSPLPNQPVSSQASKKKGSLIGVAVIGLIIGIVPFIFFLWPEFEREQLIKDGVAAQGEIISIKPTGSTYNDQPQVDLRVRVTSAEGEAFEAQTTMIINPVYLPQFQPGMKVKVRYDAADRSKIAVEETLK